MTSVRGFAGWKRLSVVGRPMARSAALVCVGLLTAAWSAPAKAQLTAEALTGGAVDNVDKFGADVDDAISAFQKGEIERSRKLLKMARETQPKLAPVEVMLAQLYILAQRADLARVELERSLRESPADPEAYLVLAEAALQEGRNREATMMYSQAAPVLEKFNDNAKRKKAFVPRLYSGDAQAAEGREDWKTAKDDLVKLLAVLEAEKADKGDSALKVEDTDLATHHVRLARALFKDGNARESYEELRKAAGLAPKVVAPEVALAQFYKQAKDKETQSKAETWIGNAQKVSKDNFATLSALARWYFDANKIKEAATYCDQALAVEPTNVDVLLLKAVVARIQKEKNALSLLERVHMEAPLNPVAINQISLALADSVKDSEKLDAKKKEENDNTARRAIQFAELNARLNPKSADAYATLGWAAYRAGRMTDAQRALGQAIQGQLNPDSLYFVATILKELDRNAEALKIVNAALDSEAPFAYHDEAHALQNRLVRRGRSSDRSESRESESAGSGASGASAPVRPTSSPTK